LPIDYCLLPIDYCPLPIDYCPLPIDYCLLPIDYCPLPIDYCLLPIFISRTKEYELSFRCVAPVSCIALSTKDRCTSCRWQVLYCRNFIEQIDGEMMNWFCK